MKLNKENFLKLINQKFIFENNPTIAVAVSGGPDSMALLFLLNRWIKFKKGKYLDNSFLKVSRTITIATKDMIKMIVIFNNPIGLFLLF